MEAGVDRYVDQDRPSNNTIDKRGLGSVTTTSRKAQMVNTAYMYQPQSFLAESLLSNRTSVKTDGSLN